MQQPLVSVIIPSYNRAHCIGKALDSLVAQTYSNWEAIVIDDGSNDNTRQVVASYVTKCRVRYIYQDNRGVSSARNHGIALAIGDYLALLDSDDIWHPWKLQLQLAVFEAFPDIVMSCTDMSAVAPDGSVVNEYYLRTMYTAYKWFTNEALFETSIDLQTISPGMSARYPGKRVWKGSLFSQMLMGNLIHTSTVLMSRSVVNKVGHFRMDWRFSEDYHYFTRICKEGPIAFTDVPSMLYQTGMPDQLTNPAYHFEGAVNYLICLREFIDKNRQRVTLPPWMMRRTLADAHLWVAELMMMHGDYTGGREHLINALRYRISCRTLQQFVIVNLPLPVRNNLRTAYRNFKNAIQGISRQCYPIAGR
jgi:glycosyltransferase involved in cell wall biosynthesis